MNGLEQLQKFVETHRSQLISAGVPQHLWQMLHRKLSQQIFDGGDVFQLLLLDYADCEREPEDPVWTVAVSKEDGLSASSPNDIFLIDHAWTFRLAAARQQLTQVPELLRRMSIIMGVDHDNLPAADCTDQVLRSMWRYTQMYALGGDTLAVEDRQPIWYVMDELGSGITHSSQPNCRVAPFIYAGDSTTYSILFPLRDIACDQMVSRDYVAGHGTHDEMTRNCLLLPWRPLDLTAEPIEQPEPGREYFLSGRVEETLPLADAPPPLVPSSAERPLKVYAAYRYVNEYLTDAGFELVDNEADADIIWVNEHFKQYAQLSLDSPDKFINQFPFENCITIKDMLAICARRSAPTHSDPNTLATYPLWLPTTYNLKTELPAFVAYYQRRAALRLDNHWIVKPWNLARGLDQHITDDLAQIMRLQPTGPKIAQKYIERPVLFRRPEVHAERGVKFDVRYVILLSGVRPLQAHVYRNFFLRFANKPFALDRYDDYEQHFTVMNYASDFELRHIPCAEFGELWQQQYPQNAWAGVETQICEMLAELLVAATEKAEPPAAIASSSQSRALYAADIMLEWEGEEGGEGGEGKMRPKLLEVNWGPDCKRACEYYPEFYNDVFRLLFRGEENETVFRKIAG